MTTTRNPSRRTVVASVVSVAALVAVALALLLPGRGPTSLRERATEVAEGLRCPTCQALSVADSNSTMAQSMRSEIRTQLGAGRSPEQIRDWFTERYGEEVLLAPDPRGVAILLWVLPAAVLVGGVAAIVLVRRRRAPVDWEEERHAPAPLSPARLGLVTVTLLAVGTAVTLVSWNGGTDDAAATASASSSADAGGASGMSARDWVGAARSLEEQQAYDDAAKAYRKALRLRPHDPSLRTRLAFTLVRDGRAEEAMTVVAPATHAKGRQRADALLVLGLAQQAEDLPEATTTLREFLDLAPDHPAADQVRRLLEDAP